MVSEGGERIAVIGIGCRFPGSHGPTQLRRMLAAGRDGVGAAPAYRARVRSGIDPRLERRDVSTRGTLEDVEAFDWRCFRISPREAKYVDPQQRLVLEASWEALEHAGLPHESIAGTRASVFVGIMWPDYAKLLAENPRQLAGYATPGTGFALAANRVSHYFDLRGPSVSIDVQCASSLTAVHLACQSLWCGDAELALAGGVNLILTPDADLMMSRAGILSSHGRCMTFDARGDGFVRSEGVGMVVLKPESRARSDGDRILAFIRSTAVNHDGRRGPLTAPSKASQSELVRLACTRAAVEPTDIDYVELHGTGTERGDPTEAAALGETVGGGRKASEPCLVGSVKSNIGHCEAAAGVAAFIKTVLAVHAREIPPSIHHHETRPEIPLDDLHLRLVTEPTEWPLRPGRPPLAGVTGLSLGGANAHVIVEGAAAETPRTSAARRPAGIDAGPEVHVLPISARTEAALRALARAYAEHLEDSVLDAEQLRDTCWTAAVRRTHHEFRYAAVATDREGLCERLRAFAAAKGNGGRGPGAWAPEAPAVVFVFGAVSPATERALERLAAEEPAVRAPYRHRRPLLERAGVRRARAFALQLAVSEAFCNAGIEPSAAFTTDGLPPMTIPLQGNGGSPATERIEIAPLDGGEPLSRDEATVVVQIGSGPLPQTAPGEKSSGEGGESVFFSPFEGGKGGRAALLTTLGELYTRGHPVRWEQFYELPGSLVTVPTYQWQRERLWIDPDDD